MIWKFENGILGQYAEKVEKNFFDKTDPAVHAAAYAAPKEVTCADAEFAGKYIDICVQYHRFYGNERALESAARVVRSIAENQREDGYLGTLAAGCEFEYFSVWNQTFTLFGLYRFYRETKEEGALRCALRCAAWLADAFIDKKRDILDCMNGGAEHSSCLYPLVLWWKETGDLNCRRLIDHISARLIKDMHLLDFTDIMKMPSIKGIEMLILYLGLVQLGIEDGRKELIDAGERYWEEVRRTQIRNTGNGSVNEWWCENGSAPSMLDISRKPNENCVAVGWMELSLLLFSQTHKAKYLSALEKTMYNHILGSISADGSDFAYYQPNFGKKVFMTMDYEYKCCRYRGVTLFAHLPSFICMEEGDRIYPVFYESGKGSGKDFSLEIKTDFPLSGKVSLYLDTPGGGKTLCLHIPEGCKSYALFVNGRERKESEKNGFLEIACPKGKTEILLKTEFAVFAERGEIDGGKVVAYHWGPLLLSLDSAYGNDVNDTSVFENAVLKKTEKMQGVLAHFVCKGLSGGRETDIDLIDYASAGRARKEDEFRVWIPVRK